MIQDPAGLLTRLPELEPLCSDPGIRRAVERGDPFKVYRALAWARVRGKLTAHRRTLDLLLRSRRAFARPPKGKLWLGTVNGFGATLLGNAEAEPDGSRIATHCVVALFALPLFPLGAYVVAGGERKGLSTSWNVFARVPLSLAAWAWSRGLAVAAAGAVAWGAYGAFHASRHHDVHVVNGFREPLTATIGDARVVVPPGARQVVNLPVGKLAARAVTADGTEVDATPIAVEAGSDVEIWNVAGAAPVYEDQVWYSEKPSQSPDGGPRLHCGEGVIRLAKVDDLFAPPPETVSIPKGQSTVVRRHVDVATAGRPDGASLCALVLMDQGREPAALRILEARARLSRWAPDDASAVGRVALAVGPAEAERVAKTALTARPDAPEVHRLAQNLLLAAGKDADLVAEYRRRAEAHPDSAADQYLLVRLLHGAEQVPALEKAVARFPDDANLLRVLTSVRAETGAFDAAEAAFVRLLAVAPTDAGQVLSDAVTAMAARGRTAEALVLLDRSFDKLDEGGRDEAAVAWSGLAAAAGRAPDALVKKLEAKKPDPVLRARCGLPPAGQEPAPPIADVYRAAAADPGKALAAVTKLSPLEGSLLERATWALLYGEAVRTGAAAAEKVLSRYMTLPAAELQRFRRYVRGESVPRPDDAGLEVRSAAAFVRSRIPALAADERTRLVAEARAGVPLGSPVVRAIATWPAAAR